MKNNKKKESNRSATLITDSDLRLPRYKIGYALIILVLIVCVLIALVPTCWAFLMGFKSVKEIYSPSPKFFPEHISFSAVSEVLKKTDFTTNIISTFIVSFGQIVSMLVISGFGGYVLSRVKPKGTKIVFAAITFTMLMPAAVRTVPLYMGFVDFPLLHISLLNTYWPFFLMAAGGAFNILLFKTFFDSIPISLIESARLDGCNDLGIFLKIVLPLSMPIVTYTSIMTFNSAWKEFLMPMLILNDKKLQTVPVVIYRIKTNSAHSISTVAMLLTLASVPPIIVFAIFQKQIMGGVNVGGVKG